MGADPLNTKDMAQLLMNDVKRVSTVTYGRETPFFLSTMRALSQAHLNIDDPPHDTEIQVKEYVYALLFKPISFKCGSGYNLFCLNLLKTYSKFKGFILYAPLSFPHLKGTNTQQSGHMGQMFSN